MSATPPGAPVDEPLGYWEGCTAEELERAWEVPRVHLFARTGSTNDVARRLAGQGAAAGTVVIAEEQRRGRGRAGRGWTSPPELGLWMSVVLRPATLETDPALPIRVAAAVADALERWTGPHVIRIKWPNDLLGEGRKLCGILCEAAWEGGRTASVTAGIGVNLLHREADFPADLRDAATSLLLLTNGPVSRYHAAGEILASLQRELSAPRAPEQLIGGRDELLGREVDVIDPESGALIASGRACGLALDGALLLEHAGRTREVRSGTVRLRP